MIFFTVSRNFISDAVHISVLLANGLRGKKTFHKQRQQGQRLKTSEFKTLDFSKSFEIQGICQFNPLNFWKVTHSDLLIRKASVNMLTLQLDNYFHTHSLGHYFLAPCQPNMAHSNKPTKQLVYNLF